MLLSQLTFRFKRFGNEPVQFHYKNKIQSAEIVIITPVFGLIIENLQENSIK